MSEAGAAMGPGDGGTENEERWHVCGVRSGVIAGYKGRIGNINACYALKMRVCRLVSGFGFSLAVKGLGSPAMIARRYFEKRIYEDQEDVDALCSFACFLQIVRKQDERAALMYSSALEADPQVTLLCLRKPSA